MGPDRGYESWIVITLTALSEMEHPSDTSTNIYCAVTPDEEVGSSTFPDVDRGRWPVDPNWSWSLSLHADGSLKTWRKVSDLVITVHGGQLMLEETMKRVAMPSRRWLTRFWPSQKTDRLRSGNHLKSG